MAHSLKDIFEEILAYGNSLPKARVYHLAPPDSFVGWRVSYSEDLAVLEYRVWGYSLERLRHLKSLSLPGDLNIETEQDRKAIAEALQKLLRGNQTIDTQKPDNRESIWQLLLKD